MSTVATPTFVAQRASGILTASQAERIAAIYLEARNRGDLEMLDTIYDPAVVAHHCSEPEEIRGLAAIKALYRATHEGLPDLRLNFDDVFFSGEKLVLRWTATGTHTGHFRSLPPTGRSIRISGVAIDRVVDGLIVEEWVDYNMLRVLVQMGIVPAAPRS